MMMMMMMLMLMLMPHLALVAEGGPLGCTVSSDR
jgi:hypothetical protein